MNLRSSAKLPTQAPLLALIVAMAVTAWMAWAQTDEARITILHDAFGKPSTLRKDGRFSAFIEYQGKRILWVRPCNPSPKQDNPGPVLWMRKTSTATAACSLAAPGFGGWLMLVTIGHLTDRAIFGGPLNLT